MSPAAMMRVRMRRKTMIGWPPPVGRIEGKERE